MASILAVVIPGYLEYSTKLDLENLALDVALTVREAQSYGAGAKVSTSGSGSFNATYGINFDLNNSNKFFFFEENGSLGYDNGIDFLINEYTVKNGYSLYDVCLSDGGNKECNKKGNDVRGTVIYFTRPNPDAIIYRRNNGGNIIGGPWESASLEFISPDQATTTVQIRKTGAISILR